MLFEVDTDSGKKEEVEVDPIYSEDMEELEIMERDDLQEWVISEPRILDEEMLIVTSEFAGFEETRHRLDVLALDKTAKLVVIELKRDRADRETDLQAIKYASFCSTLTAKDIQQLYREFHDKRSEDDLSPEDIGERFIEFIDIDKELTTTDSGFAEFELDNRPRVLLAAGEFGDEVTHPVIWLRQEFGVEISCINITAYEYDEKYLIKGEQVIPTEESEEYMTKRREKDDKDKSKRSKNTIDVLLDNSIIEKGDMVLFHDRFLDESWMSDAAEKKWNPDDEFWQGTITGKKGSSDNVRWEYDGKEYSFNRLTDTILEKINEDDEDTIDSTGKPYQYWDPIDSEGEHLIDLRKKVED